MIVRALEGFLLHNNKLPNRQDIAALNIPELRGENMLHLISRARRVHRRL